MVDLPGYTFGKRDDPTPTRRCYCGRGCAPGECAAPEGEREALAKALFEADAEFERVRTGSDYVLWDDIGDGWTIKSRYRALADAALATLPAPTDERDALLRDLLAWRDRRFVRNLGDEFASIIERARVLIGGSKDE